MPLPGVVDLFLELATIPSPSGEERAAPGGVRDVDEGEGRPRPLGAGAVPATDGIDGIDGIDGTGRRAG